MGTRHQSGLSQHLETITNTENGHSLVGRINNLSHDGSVAGNGSCAQVISIAKSARQNNCFDALSVMGSVPQCDWFASGEADGALCIAVIE
jgi:hypothetical protein